MQQSASSETYDANGIAKGKGDGIGVASHDKGAFWAVAFGSDFMWRMPIGFVFRASGDYLPAVDAWTDDYLLRGDTSLEIPLIEWLSFKIRALDEYDNSPAEGTDRNRFTFTGLLSLTL